MFAQMCGKEVVLLLLVGRIVEVFARFLFEIGLEEKVDDRRVVEQSVDVGAEATVIGEASVHATVTVNAVERTAVSLADSPSIVYLITLAWCVGVEEAELDLTGHLVAFKDCARREQSEAR